MDVHYQQMCCCILCKPLASLFLFVCRPLHAHSSKRSAGEHLDVRLLLILSSAPFFSAHPALSPLSTPLFIPPSVTGQTDEEKCQPPDERESGSEVERQRRDQWGERPPCPSVRLAVSLSPDCTLSLAIPRFFAPFRQLFFFTHSCLVLSLVEFRIGPECFLSFPLPSPPVIFLWTHSSPPHQVLRINFPPHFRLSVKIFVLSPSLPFLPPPLTFIFLTCSSSPLSPSVWVW